MILVALAKLSLLVFSSSSGWGITSSIVFVVILDSSGIAVVEEEVLFHDSGIIYIHKYHTISDADEYTGWRLDKMLVLRDLLLRSDACISAFKCAII